VTWKGTLIYRATMIASPTTQLDGASILGHMQKLGSEPGRTHPTGCFLDSTPYVGSVSTADGRSSSYRFEWNKVMRSPWRKSLFSCRNIENSYVLQARSDVIIAQGEHQAELLHHSNPDSMSQHAATSVFDVRPPASLSRTHTDPDGTGRPL
jgi:hypothetical protein